MIPKKIHYCWFGHNPMPELAKRCIESWKRYCPDYELVEWNETNFDLAMNTYVQEAYNAKKWAFVTDYVRLYALVNYGGIYMDTDVEVTGSLDDFLKNEAFSGFETPKSVQTGIMASIKDFPLFKGLLATYDDRHFVREDGCFDLTTNVYSITKYCLEHGLVLNNREQCIEGLRIYPNDYFCPKDVQSGVIALTENTHTIHHFSGSWNSDKEKKWHEWEIRMCRYRYGKLVINAKLVRLVHLVYISGVKGIKWKIRSVLAK